MDIESQITSPAWPRAMRTPDATSRAVRRSSAKARCLAATRSELDLMKAVCEAEAPRLSAAFSPRLEPAALDLAMALAAQSPSASPGDRVDAQRLRADA